MTRNRFLDKAWQKTHLKRIKQRAGNRYTPELNVDLPIAEIFDGISRTDNFYILIRKHYGKLNREFNRVSPKYDDKETQKIYQILQREIFSLSKLLGKLKKYNANTIPWLTISQHTQKAKEIIWKFLDKLREEKKKVEKQNKTDNKHRGRSASERLSFEIHHIYETQKELNYFEELSSSTKLSNFPFLLLTGVAGTGKTHLLCDIVEKRIHGGLPAVLTFGELFTTTKDPSGPYLISLCFSLKLKLTLFFPNLLLNI